MHVLASDFGGLVWVFLAIPGVLIVLAVASFVPASRGHWSGVLLAAPAALLGLLFAALLMLASAKSGLMPLGMYALLLTPPLLGILSLGVWSERRRSRG